MTQQCTQCDVYNAKQVSRATWVCPDCGHDVSIAYVFLMDALDRSEEDRQQKRKARTKDQVEKS